MRYTLIDLLAALVAILLISFVLKELIPDYGQEVSLDSNRPIYVVVGVTGVGKSSFIKAVGGKHVSSKEPPGVGRIMKSRKIRCFFRLNPALVKFTETPALETEKCGVYEFKSVQTPPGYLIDSPGFDGSNRTRSDMDVLDHIYTELDLMNKTDKFVMGLIFLHDIRDDRIKGSVENVSRICAMLFITNADVYKALENTIDMVERLWGAEGIAKITLVTTKWTNSTDGRVRKHEEHKETMIKESWSRPAKCNSKVERWDGTDNSAHKIIANLHERPRPQFRHLDECRKVAEAQKPYLSQPIQRRNIPWFFQR